MKALWGLLTFVATISGAFASDDGRTPRERSDAGISALSHSSSILTPNACSPIALNRYMQPEMLLRDNQSIAINASLASRIGGILDEYARFDFDISTRSVCVGLYQFGEKNARSHEQGYLLFDPTIIHYLNSEFPKRTMYSLDQVVFHELAHQFQYWFGDRFQADATVKRSELTADCVAGTLLAKKGKKYGESLWAMTRKGMLEAAFDFGDFQFESPDHHGLPLERYDAVKIGIDLPASLTLNGILNRCQDAIQKQFD